MNALAHSRPSTPDPARWTLWLGRTVLTLWVGFWVWFNVASGIGEMAGSGSSVDLIAHGALALVLLGIGLVGWRWRRAGGITLLATTVVFAMVFKLAIPALLLAPPATAGLLLLASHHLATRNP